MPDRSAIVLCIDGLGARMLGPYANTWFATRHFDRLASQSLLLEFTFTDSSELLGSYQSLWSGEPFYSALKKEVADNRLAEKLAGVGIETTLFTDEARLAEWSLAEEFDRTILHATEKIDLAANDPSETALADYFAAAIEQAVLIKPGNLIWLHSQGLAGPWDAPYEMRSQFADEEDPDPPTFIQPPSPSFDTGELDPDIRLGFQQACAAQVVLLDQFIGILLEHIEKLPTSKQPLLILTSPRGFPMGGGGRFGLANESLYDDSIHVPLLVRWPDRRQSLNRHQGIRHVSCLSEFLFDWFQYTPNDLDWVDHVLPRRNCEWVLAASQSGVSLRTHGWKFLDNGIQQQLFVKPDDRWETNDIIRKCRGVGEEMSELCETMVEEIKTTGACEKRTLPEQLAENVS